MLSDIDELLKNIGQNEQYVFSKDLVVEVIGEYRILVDETDQREVFLVSGVEVKKRPNQLVSTNSSNGGYISPEKHRPLIYIEFV